MFLYSISAYDTNTLENLLDTLSNGETLSEKVSVNTHNSSFLQNLNFCFTLFSGFPAFLFRLEKYSYQAPAVPLSRLTHCGCHKSKFQFWLELHSAVQNTGKCETKAPNKCSRNSQNSSWLTKGKFDNIHLIYIFFEIICYNYYFRIGVVLVDYALLAFSSISSKNHQQLMKRTSNLFSIRWRIKFTVCYANAES